jgi:ATP-dependent Lon protease
MAAEIKTDLEDVAIPDDLPVLPIRDLVVFPYMIVPLYVSRHVSQAALDRALQSDKLVFLVAQKEAGLDEPALEDLHPIGTIGMVMRLRKLPDGRTKALVQGLVKGQLDRLVKHDEALIGHVERIHEIPMEEPTIEVEALERSVRDHLERLAQAGRPISPDVMLVLGQINDPGRLADLCAANLGLVVEVAQRILSVLDPIERLKSINDYLTHESKLAEMQQQIESQAKEEISRSQREYYLRQQLRQIQQELGDGKSEDIRDLGMRLEKAGLPPQAAEEAKRQLRRLEQMSSESAESSVLRTYVEWIADLPWSRRTEDALDLKVARKILDDDHYDLEAVKERILDYLGVRKLKHDMKGPILCFVGPPGVGKTSLGRSIARSLGRQFVRVSLGGVRDEAEVRGHRRTYVGALPGRIIQAIKQAGVRNPVLMLDEIDKIGGGGDFRGDPHAALLEVLDPEQNHQFRDHYLNLDFDLSQVLFIATANILDNVPAPLRDRMEVIPLQGYTEDEKLRIAQTHLVPKERAENGLDSKGLRLTDSALRRIIVEYTREAGLRNLERQIATVCRKVARRVAEGEHPRSHITARDIPTFLGLPKFLGEAEMEADAVGEATGLAWTPAGGEILRIEVSAMRGRGGLTLTGQLGDVMKESARAALTWTRAHAADLGLSEEYFKNHELHIHVPAGAIPKDGPSAGVTLAVAIVSLVTGRSVHRDVATTGELTLRGRVLPVGGIKEKLLAAVRAGLVRVVVPKGNENDLKEMPPNVRRKLDIVLASALPDVLKAALLDPPSRRRSGERGRPRSPGRKGGRAAARVSRRR